MNMLRIGLAVLAATLLVGCSQSKFQKYNGPEVTRIVVFKDDLRMHLMHGDKVLTSYDVDLGFQPEGPKQFEGDGKTPEGRYLIDRRNPRSSFYLSIGLNYPNRKDVEYAQSQGKKPGGDIFIHGQATGPNRSGENWTAGCIAVTNPEMREIYAMVQEGTPIDIYP